MTKKLVNEDESRILNEVLAEGNVEKLRQALIPELENSFIEHLKLVGLTDSKGPLPVLANPENNSLVLELCGEYYCISDTDKEGIHLGSKVRYNKERGDYDFKKDEMGLYMNLDEFWGLVTLDKHKKLGDMSVQLPKIICGNKSYVASPADNDRINISEIIEK